MAIPTQAQLYEEVDRRFAAEHPDAPQRLDPNDPNQHQWVQDWLHLRDKTLNEWTDHVFFEHFPNAGQLDPNNPDHADLIKYWNDIRCQINGEQGQFNWDGQQQAQQVQPLEIVSIENHSSGNGFVLRFNRPLQDLPEAIRFLWNQEYPPTGGTIGLIDQSSVHLELTLQALQTLPEDLVRRLSELGVMRAE
jgi:hypothetical protein